MQGSNNTTPFAISSSHLPVQPRARSTAHATHSHCPLVACATAPPLPRQPSGLPPQRVPTPQRLGGDLHVVRREDDAAHYPAIILEDEVLRVPLQEQREGGRQQEPILPAGWGAAGRANDKGQEWGQG